MKALIAAVCIAALTGCAAVGTQTPQQQLQGYCAVSVPEFAAVDTVKDQLDANAAKLVSIAAPINAAICTPAAINAATPETVQQYLAQVLPAVTVLGIELASKKNAAAPAVGASQ